jgi:hypothetical protein
MKYSSSFSHDLNFGEKAEDWLNNLFNNGKLIEVKSDRLIHKTGNLYIEYKSRNKPSGLATTTANYWIYRMDVLDAAILLPTESLKKVCRVYYKNNEFKMKGGDNNTSEGFLIPLIRLLKDLALLSQNDENTI